MSSPTPLNSLALARLCLFVRVKEPVHHSKPLNRLIISTSVRCEQGRFMSPLFFVKFSFSFFYFFFRNPVSHSGRACAAHNSVCRARRVFASVNPRIFCQVFFFNLSIFFRRVPAPPGTTFAWRRSADAVLLLPPRIFCQALFSRAPNFFTPPPRLRLLLRLSRPLVFFNPAPNIIPRAPKLRR